MIFSTFFGLLLLSSNTLKPVSSAAIQPRVVSTLDSETPLVHNGTANTTDTDIDDMTDFFKKYTELEVPIPGAESSEDGHSAGRPKIHITRTPAYMERVVQLQMEFGLPQTGILDYVLVNKTKTTDRCGMIDPPSDPNAPAAYRLVSKWMTKYNKNAKQHHLTYSFQTNTFPSKITSSKIRKGVLSAMCMWERNSNVRFVRNVGHNKDADITIGFGKGDHGDNYAFDGQGGTLAHAFYPESGMLHFDEEEPWYLALTDRDVFSKRDIYTVASHELGHNLGLDHSSQTALMAPFYDFQGTFKNYRLPADDKAGLESMYGRYKKSDPLTEAHGNACKELKRLFKVESSVPLGSSGGSGGSFTTTTTTARPNTPRRTTTKRTTTTTTTQRTSTQSDTSCRDAPHLGEYCQYWKDNGYCTTYSQQEAMNRQCRKTCGLCSNSDDEDGVCTIKRFDEFTPTYDGTGRLQFYVYKDMYYFYGDASYSSRNNLLKSQANPKFYSDPKTTKAGQRETARKYPKTHSAPTAVVRTRRWFLIFDAQGNVDQYMNGGPSMAHLNKYTTGGLFQNYPHDTVDSAHREYVGSKEIVTLFKGNKMYQYVESSSSSMFDFKKSDGFVISFRPVQDRFGLDISEWKGVSACDIDSVFTYQKVAYFLKGNVFWPAESSQKSVGRDIRYHFFRCPDSKDVTHRIPTECGKGSASSIRFSVIQSLAFFILSVVFART